MPSAAKSSFESALVDVTNLMEFHANEGGDAPGRRPANLQSLNKSAVVLLCAAWESYVEYVITECAAANITEAELPKDLMKSLRKLVSRYVRDSKDESAWIKTAGSGWKDVAREVVTAKVSLLNTPKTNQVSILFEDILGVTKVENIWSWAKNELGGPARRLDDFVKLRGSIAHGAQKDSVNKNQVTGAQDLIVRLVNKVEERLTSDALLE